MRPAGPRRRWPVRLSLFKGALSVNAMDSTERRRTNALADLKSQAANLRREIASYQVKIEFYASECSDGADAYANEMRPHIGKAEAALREVEALIAELEAVPVQLSLL
jgi:TPP-dependent trihydroxycyclohexane-1,2-dione (THcHDO) dehydratase